MSSVRSNFAANLVGQAWIALIQLLAVPIYLKLLGVEAYGLMGFFVVLQATAQVFDLGLGPTLTREVARRRTSSSDLADARSLVKTVFGAYLGIAALIAMAVALAAPFFASSVIRAEKLGSETVRHALIVMALIIPVIWGANIFNAVLVGLERQVLVNGLRIAMVTVSVAGSLLVLWLVSADVTAFFLWQLVAGVLSLLTSAWIVHRVLPPGPSRFHASLLKSIWRFAASMSAISIGGIALGQVDKWLLINLLPLQSYGYYTVATTVANVLYFVIASIFVAIFPRFSMLAAAGRYEELRALFLLGTQVVVAALIPLALIVSIYSHEIFLLWTHNAQVAAHGAPIASVLVLGTMVNGLMNLPYAAQLALGWTRLALALVYGLLAIFLPSLVILISKLGPLGAAYAWLGLNLLYFVVGAPLTLRKLMPGLGWRWFGGSILPGLVASAAVVAAGWLVLPERFDSLVRASSLLLLLGLAMTAAVFAGGQTRTWLLARVARG